MNKPAESPGYNVHVPNVERGVAKMLDARLTKHKIVYQTTH